MNRSEETVEVFFTNTDNPAPFRLESRDFPSKSVAVCRLQGNNDRLTAPAGHAPLHLVGMKKIPDGFGSIEVTNTINFSQEIKRVPRDILIDSGSFTKQKERRRRTPRRKKTNTLLRMVNSECYRIHPF